MRHATTQFRALVEIVIASTKPAEGDVAAVEHTRAVALLDLIGHATAASKMAEEIANAYECGDFNSVEFAQGAGWMLAHAQRYATTMWENVACESAKVFAPPF